MADEALTLLGRRASLRTAVPDAEPSGGLTAAWAETWRAKPRATTAVERKVLLNILIVIGLIWDVFGEKSWAMNDWMSAALPEREKRCVKM
jgi:hypothetical protein